MAQHQLDVQEPGHLQICRKSGQARDLVPAFLPSHPLADYAHHAIMLRTKHGRPAAPQRRPGVRTACAIALTSVALGACSGGGGAAPKIGLASMQVLRFPIPGDFESLDPATLDKVSDSEIAHNLFDGLVRFDSNLNIVPDIADPMP